MDQVLSNEVTLKISQIPANWSIEAADLINKVLYLI